MPTTMIRIVDETATGDSLNEITLPFEQSTTTVKEIITNRVIAEVQAYNAKVTEHFMGLIRPTQAEETLNGYKMKQRTQIDPEKQVYVALDAFTKNGYFVFINDLQAESLDQKVNLSPDLKISFVKLTPLVGG